MEPELELEPQGTGAGAGILKFRDRPPAPGQTKVIHIGKVKKVIKVDILS